MHSFLIEMCRSCLATNVDLKEYMVVENKEIKCFDAVKMIFPNVMVSAFCGYGLCGVCRNLLKSVVIFQRRLFESHDAYSKYLQMLNFSNHNKFSLLIVQHLKKGYLPMLKTLKGSELKQAQNTCNQIATNDIHFQDILNNEDLNCDTYKDVDNFLGELDPKLHIEENTLVKTLQEECKNIDNVIDSIKKEVTIPDNDNCNQMDFTITENPMFVRHIKEEHENLIHESISRIDEHISLPGNDSCYQFDSKIEVKEECIATWESTKNECEHFETVFICEEQSKNEISPNLSAINFKQEESTTINSKEKTSPILLTEHEVDLRKSKRPYKCHKLSHTGEWPNKCDVCESSFSTSASLKRHKRVHTGERPFKCDVCEKRFSEISNLVSHKRIHTGERPYKCDVCGMSFAKNSGLIGHKRIHTGERPYKCDVCEKSFTRTSHLIRHKKGIHSGERPYKCDACESSFSYSSHLITHRRVHTGERPFKCDVCEKSFSQNSNLVIHKRSHTGERPHKCDVCESSFSTSSYLIKHKRLHTGERPFKCDVCEKSFSENSNLVIHKRVHTGERPYICDVCEMSFSNNSCLIGHKHIHTGERPYKCDVCEKSFSRTSHLIRHQKGTH